MKERMVDIPTAAGTMDAFVAHPSDGGPFPAVIIYMDVWGLREELFDIARRIAVAGYYCMVPNFYYREGKIRSEYRNDKGQMITLDSLDAERRALVLAPLARLSDAMVIEDTGAILRFLDTDPSARRNSPVGCIGYCMGGRHVFQAVAHYPDRFRAAASLHGTDLVIDGPESPHLGVLKGGGELYCGFGEKDRHTPLSTVEAVEQTLRSRGPRYRYEVHKGADHGYALPDRDVFDKQGANRDWEIIFPMFHRQLQPYLT